MGVLTAIGVEGFAEGGGVVEEAEERRVHLTLELGLGTYCAPWRVSTFWSF